MAVGLRRVRTTLHRQCRLIHLVLGDQRANIEHALAVDGLAKLLELVSAPGFGAAVATLTAPLASLPELLAVRP